MVKLSNNIQVVGLFHVMPVLVVHLIPADVTFILPADDRRHACLRCCQSRTARVHVVQWERRTHDNSTSVRPHFIVDLLGPSQRSPTDRLPVNDVVRFAADVADYVVRFHPITFWGCHRAEALLLLRLAFPKRPFLFRDGVLRLLLLAPFPLPVVVLALVHPP